MQTVKFWKPLQIHDDSVKLFITVKVALQYYNWKAWKEKSLKTTRIEQISEFCGQIIYFLSGNIYKLFITKSDTEKPLLKLADISIKEQHWSIGEVCFLCE